MMMPVKAKSGPLFWLKCKELYFQCLIHRVCTIRGFFPNNFTLSYGLGVRFWGNVNIAIARPKNRRKSAYWRDDLCNFYKFRLPPLLAYNNGLEKMEWNFDEYFPGDDYRH